MRNWPEKPVRHWVNFVCVETTRRVQRIPGGEPAAYLDGIELGSLLRAEQRGTAIALAAARRPSASWILPEIHPQSLGQLFFALELQAAYQGAWQIDLSYTQYSGAGRYNLINDRDFIGGFIKYSF